MPPAPDAPVILIVEDRAEVRALVRRTLVEAGFTVQEAPDGDAGLAQALAAPPALVILDVGLPGRSGIDVARALRAAGVEVPVLMLTARERVVDRVTGLEAGADDYLVKPFDCDELVARVRALLRRDARRGEGQPIRVGDLVVDPLARTAIRGGRVLALTQKEFALLELLARHAGRAVSREQIAEQAWRGAATPGGNVVDVYVSYLRAKLSAAGEPELLRTVRGTGYLLAPADAG